MCLLRQGESRYLRDALYCLFLAFELVPDTFQDTRKGYPYIYMRRTAYFLLLSLFCFLRDWIYEELLDELVDLGGGELSGEIVELGGTDGKRRWTGGNCGE